MIEKLLKRFLSEEGKMVYAAMDKWAETQDLNRDYIPQIRTMKDNIAMYGTVVDRACISRQHNRQLGEAKKRNALRAASETAAQILMGEKFEENSREVHSGVHIRTMAGNTSLNQQDAQLQAMQRMYNQQLGTQGLMNQGQGLMQGQSTYPQEYHQCP